MLWSTLLKIESLYKINIHLFEGQYGKCHLTCKVEFSQRELLAFYLKNSEIKQLLVEALQLGSLH